jgi:hypothetical protein|tara:strand:- start:253 stop:456 length:204 start_codon:yes stop_codon:yes gene_type:complete
MIDITKVQAYDIPQDIKVLENKNVELINDNGILKRQSKRSMALVVLLIIIGGITIYELNKKRNESEV